MAFKNDEHGFVFKCDDIKITRDSTTWAMRLSQLARQPGTVYILTYSLPVPAAIQTSLSKHPQNLYLIANSLFQERAIQLARANPGIHVGLRPDMHSKVVMVAPETLYVSSENFGHSGMHETTVGFHSEAA